MLINNERIKRNFGKFKTEINDINYLLLMSNIIRKINRDIYITKMKEMEQIILSCIEDDVIKSQVRNSLDLLIPMSLNDNVYNMIKKPLQTFGRVSMQNIVSFANCLDNTLILIDSFGGIEGYEKFLRDVDECITNDGNVYSIVEEYVLCS